MPELTKVQTGFLEPQGPFKLDPGTESAPGIYFEGDENTGFYRSAEDELALSVAGSEKYKFTSEGLKFNGTSLDGTPYLGDIDKSISDTAVDVFVYDTSRDTDGGAWRKRTQHTSWYNETLNTSTRGSRREFPAVAVIVAETDKVTIYDGDDPDLPMWMVFTKSSNDDVNWLGGDVNAPNSSDTIFALNGIIASGITSGAAGRLVWANFVSDEGYNMVHVGKWKFNGGIGTRNDGLSWYQVSSTLALVNRSVNDIAMTVLPNAPIDETTGLPIPTIAVATDGGVSVIKDDGTVVDITQNHAQTTTVGTVVFDSKTNNILFTTDYSSGTPTTQHYKINAAPIPSSDAAATTNYYRGFQNHTYKIQSSGNVTTPKLIGYEIEDIVDMGGNGLFAVRTTTSSSYGSGLNIFKEYPGSTNTDNSIITYISSNYNTGWMHGNIKGAFLSDTTAESLTANTNLASNFTQVATARLTSETYDAGDTSWQVVDDAATDNGYIMIQMSGLTIGQSYIVSMTWDNNATLDAGYNHQIIHKNGLAGENSTFLNHWDKTNASSETLTGVFVAQSVNDDDLLIYANAITLNVSNFIVRAVDDEDRSVNNKGLAVYGTVTKSPVAGSGATAAELVAYSGWSSSNYLIQPYNSGLDFGTGNWCYMFWYNPNDAASGNVLFARWSYNVNGSTAGRISVYFNSGNLRLDTTDDAGSSYQGHVGTDGTQDTNTWHCGVILRRGTNIEIWIDGVRYVNNTLDSTSDGSYTNTSAILEIGNTPGAGSADSGIQLALLRASATAPSPEQIKKIYEDEKVLFQENAACTLYGSSDAVTALAYDEVTDRLHVGTSSGRSDFQGLRRINNTTTAVTTAISAHDGFIIEQ